MAKDQKDNEDTYQYISPHLLTFFYEFGIDKLPLNFFLFSSKLLPAGSPYEKVKELVEGRWRKEVKGKLGINVNLYSLKHKQATELAANVHSIKDLSNFLRHSSEDVTKNYIRKYKPTVDYSFFENQKSLPLKNKKS